MIVNFCQKIGQFIMNEKEIINNILKASNIINYKSRRSGANWIVISLSASELFDDVFKRERVRNNREQKINDLLKINDKQ
jgi:hypothetical protein